MRLDKQEQTLNDDLSFINKIKKNMSNAHLFIAMQQMLYYTVMAVCIITLPTLIIGVIISIIQAATQINEMTITFVPKFIVMFMLILLLGPWLMHKLVLIMQNYMHNLPTYIR